LHQSSPYPSIAQQRRLHTLRQGCVSFSMASFWEGGLNFQFN